MTFGEKLLYLRKSKGMTQEQLATQVTVSRQTISKWELGESMPDIDKVLLLSKLFAVSADYLLNNEIENDMDSPIIKRTLSQSNKIYRKNTLSVTGIVLSSIGILGNLVLWILSTMIKVHVTKSIIMPGGTTRYYGGGNVLGYDFWTFILEYRLMAIFWILLILIIAGMALLFTGFKKQ
jgi:transcriptional regulator with XRE-family HTH domain